MQEELWKEVKNLKEGTTNEINQDEVIALVRRLNYGNQRIIANGLADDVLIAELSRRLVERGDTLKQLYDTIEDLDV